MTDAELITTLAELATNQSLNETLKRKPYAMRYWLKVLAMNVELQSI